MILSVACVIINPFLKFYNWHIFKFEIAFIITGFNYSNEDVKQVVG